MTLCIHLDPKLADGLEKEAASKNLEVDDLVEEAIWRYLMPRRERPLSIILGSRHPERVIRF
jgi:hypothetical protein